LTHSVRAYIHTYIYIHTYRGRDQGHVILTASSTYLFGSAYYWFHGFYSQVILHLIFGWELPIQIMIMIRIMDIDNRVGKEDMGVKTYRRLLPNKNKDKISSQ